jgi:site-specific DNA recombinase
MRTEVKVKKNVFGSELGQKDVGNIPVSSADASSARIGIIESERIESGATESAWAAGARIAAYARVSSQKQEKDETINSQLAAIRNYLQIKDLHVPDEHVFTDDGFSGSTLVRPGLDGLRDAIAMNSYDRVVVYDPDRLARSYVYQMLLLDEAKWHNCEIEFIRCPIGKSPDEHLLLQMQGVIAEYERAKIAERTRRGKLHKMREGKLVTAKRTFGYAYRPASGDMPARLELIQEEADAVRKIYFWYNSEPVSEQAIAQRLNDSGVPTVKGGFWHASSVSNILRNSMYTGTGYAHRVESVEPRRKQLKTVYRKYDKTSSRDRPRDEWMPFHCPQIIEAEVFELAQERVQHNKKLSARRTEKEYLLRGLILCPECNRRMAADGRAMKYTCAYTRKSMVGRHGGVMCSNNVRFPVKDLDQLVWDELVKIIKKPDNLKLYYKKHSGNIVPGATNGVLKLEEKKAKFKEQIDRVNNLFIRGMIDEKEHIERHNSLKNMVHMVQLQLNKNKQDHVDEAEIEKMLSSFSEFSKNVKIQLREASFSMKRFIVEQLVRCVNLTKNEVVIEFSAPLKRCTLHTMSADS